jgi:hypothetical protein
MSTALCTIAGFYGANMCTRQGSHAETLDNAFDSGKCVPLGSSSESAHTVKDWHNIQCAASAPCSHASAYAVHNTYLATIIKQDHLHMCHFQALSAMHACPWMMKLHADGEFTMEYQWSPLFGMHSQP